MKKNLLFFCAIALMILSGCQQEFGDQNEVNGKPKVLSISIKNANLRTRAEAATGPYDDIESAISNYQIFLFKTDKTLFATKYIEGSSDAPTEFILKEGDAPTDVVVIANVGSEIILGAGEGKDNLEALTTSGLSITEQTAGSLLQSGEAPISTSSTITPVTLKYVTSRISLKSVTLFSEKAATLTNSGDGKGVNALLDDANISEISISNVYILNAAAGSYLTGTNLYLSQSATALLSGSEDALGGIPADAFFPRITPSYSTDYLSCKVEKAIDADYYPYFYVWENSYSDAIYTSADSHEGITLLTIECSVMLKGTTESVMRYYTVPFTTIAKGAPTTGADGFSTIRNHHYHITVDIATSGSTNPYAVTKSMFVKVNPSDWEDVTVSKVEFK